MTHPVKHISTLLAALFMLLACPALLLAGPSPTWQKAIHFPSGSSGGLVVHGNTAYVVNSWSRGDGVLVFDIQNPAQPRFVQGLRSRGYMMAVVAQNGYLYAPTWFSMAVYNIQEPHAPWLVRNMLIDFPRGDIFTTGVDGHTLYQGGKRNGLRVFDISEPDSPVLVDYLPDTGAVLQIMTDHGRMVLRTRGHDAEIYTVEDNRLEKRSSLRVRGSGMLVGPALYENIKNAMVIHDVSDLDHPVAAVSKIPGLNFIAQDQQKLLAQGPDHTFVVLDISEPLKPKEIRRIKLPEGLDITLGRRVFRTNHLIFLDNQTRDLRIVDLSGDTAKNLGQTPIMHSAGYLALAGDGQALLSYSYRTQSTLLKVDLNRQGPTSLTSLAMVPGNSKTLFTVHPQQYASNFKRLGKYVLLGDGLVDLSDAKHPQVVHPMTRAAANIAVDDRHVAYLAQNDRLTLLDVSKLPAIKPLSVFNSPSKKSRILDVLIKGKTAWVFLYSGDHTQLLALDVTDPAAPKRLGQCDIASSITGVIQGRYLYAAGVTQRNGPTTLSIIDISDPSHPRVAATATDIIKDNCYRATIHNGLLYVADPAFGIKAVDIQNPLHPKLVTIFTGPDDTSPAYTDFTFKDDTLLGLRFSQIDVWKLPAH